MAGPVTKRQRLCVDVSRVQRVENRVVDLAVGDHHLAGVDARPAFKVGVQSARFLDDDLQSTISS